MDKKTFLVLLYLTALLPITYMIGQLYLPNRGWIGIGLLNMVTLLLMFLLFGAAKDTTSYKKKRFGLVLISLLIGAMLFSGMIDSFLIKGSLRLHTMLNSNSVMAPTTGTVTPELTIPAPSPKESASSESSSAITGTIMLESDEDIISQKPVTDETALEVKKEVSSSLVNGSYGSVIPYLVKTYNLKDTDKAYPKFTRVSVKNSLYPSFATAYSKGMIGTSINPASKVSCDTYLVLKGIAAGWKVSYSGSPFAAYRAEAEKREAVNGCSKGSFVSSKTL